VQEPVEQYPPWEYETLYKVQNCLSNNLPLKNWLESLQFEAAIIIYSLLEIIKQEKNLQLDFYINPFLKQMLLFARLDQ